jgi:mannose-1-phosphate guanylyltransferase
VPPEMGWSDLGSWDALYQQRARDDWAIWFKAA